MLSVFLYSVLSTILYCYYTTLYIVHLAPCHIDITILSVNLTQAWPQKALYAPPCAIWHICTISVLSLRGERPEGM